MQHFPIFLDLADRRVVLAGNGEVALAKLRLLVRTQARVQVFAPEPEPALIAACHESGLPLHRRAAEPADLAGAALAYGAHDEAAADARLARLARAAGVLVNIVDNLEASDFITPAIVDRDPVTVAIGTEGAAPVLARAIKTDLESRLPAGLGTLARAGKLFRHAAEALPQGRARREFWADYYFRTGPEVLAEAGEDLLDHALHALLAQHLQARPEGGRVDLVGAGPGDPELLTLQARKLLDLAEVVIHDAAVPRAILDLARREAVFVTSSDDDTALMITHAQEGARVVRLAMGAGDSADTAALTAAGVVWALSPGLPAPRRLRVVARSGLRRQA